MRRDFGSCEKGSVELIRISDGQGIFAEIMTLGATLRKLEVPDKNGKPRDVVLGHETAAEYLEKRDYFGATVGRVANRIGGATFPLNGETVRVTGNVGGGKNQLHGGPDGFSFRLWTVEAVSDDEVRFGLVSPDGDQGFPGTLKAEVTYSLKTPGELKLQYRSICDRDCPVNFTNHTYFNLDGQDSGPVDEQTMRINADCYTPLGEGLVPTGEIRSLDGLDRDARKMQPLKHFFNSAELAESKGLDCNFCINDSGRIGRGTEPAAVYCGAVSGIRMECYTDQPGVQAYTCGGMKERNGKEGAVYGPHHALCLETQGYPDAVNHPNFENTVRRAGEVFETVTIYRFSLRRE